MYQLRRMGRIDADLLWEKTKDLEIILLHVLHFEDLGGIEGGSPLQRHRRSAHQWLRPRPDGFRFQVRSNGQVASTGQGMLGSAASKCYRVCVPGSQDNYTTWCALTGNRPEKKSMKAWKKSAALFSARVVLGNIDQIVNICHNFFIIMTDDIIPKC